MKESIHIVYVYYILYMCFFVLLTYIFFMLSIRFEYYERGGVFFTSEKVINERLIVKKYVVKAID